MHHHTGPAIACTITPGQSLHTPPRQASHCMHHHTATNYKHHHTRPVIACTITSGQSLHTPGQSLHAPPHLASHYTYHHTGPVTARTTTPGQSLHTPPHQASHCTHHTQPHQASHCMHLQCRLNKTGVSSKTRSRQHQGAAALVGIQHLGFAHTQETVHWGLKRLGWQLKPRFHHQHSPSLAIAVCWA